MDSRCRLTRCRGFRRDVPENRTTTRPAVGCVAVGSGRMKYGMMLVVALIVAVFAAMGAEGGAVVHARDTLLSPQQYGGDAAYDTRKSEPAGLRTVSASDYRRKSLPVPLPRTINTPLGVASTLRIVHFIGIRYSPAQSLIPHPSYDRPRRFASVDSG